MKFTKRDWSVAVALFVVALALRVPFRTTLAYHWDCAGFAVVLLCLNGLDLHTLERGGTYGRALLNYVPLGGLLGLGWSMVQELRREHQS